MPAFLRENARWLAGGFLLMFFSSFGQTFFISLSAGAIREEYGLSNGAWGSLYMAATLASALTLPRLGQIVDTRSVRSVALLIIPGLAIATVAMAFSRHIAMLLLTLYMLRLFGQGMMMHLGFSAIGKWFSAQRGKALSLTAIGINFGEALLPVSFVFLTGLIGWRMSWLVATAVIVLVALPVITTLVAQERAPRSSDPVSKAPVGRQWTRSEALRDPAFYLLMLCVMGPPFIVTTIFFHQVYLVDLRGWSLEVFASTFFVSSSMTVVFALISGALIDRFTGVRLLPFVLLPLGTGCLVLASVDAQWSAFAFMALFGISNGFASTLFGAIWPEVYGIKHLGSIRALTVAFLVLASAVGPGLSGFLIDLGVWYPYQIAAMGLYCLLVSPIMLAVSRHLSRRALRDAELAATPQA